MKLLNTLLVLILLSIFSGQTFAQDQTTPVENESGETTDNEDLYIDGSEEEECT